MLTWMGIFALIAAATAMACLVRLATPLGLIDHPGGRKTHVRPVPLVGGLAIFLALLVTATVMGFAEQAAYFMFALSIVIAAGLWDDITDLRPRVKFAIQIAASALMIWGAGVQLHSVGDLLGWRPIGLSFASIPLTMFAIVGVVNAVNMMDGLDGLAGSVALIAFAWFAAVAATSGLHVQLQTALVLCGAIAGFLLFNLRFPWQKQARAFLGDAGSLMIGFAAGWFAIDLSQGPGRTFPPIAALWIVVLPLADCVSLIARRLRARKSPFVADRRHIHHYLLACGFSHGQAVATLVGLSAVFGAVGYFAWRFEVPEPVLFWIFFVGFFAYHHWIQRAWRSVDAREDSSEVDVTEAGKILVS